LFGDKRRPAATIAAEIDRIIGANLRRAREDVHLGQHELATLLGLSVHVLIRYEEGQERAPAPVLLEVTRHLGCHLTDLFAGMPSMEPEEDFRGSRPEAPAPASSPPEPIMPNVAANSPNATGEAVAVAKVIQAYSDLKNPAVRSTLLALLQALG
jgi:transcriptional regulator with XRE-family HTH domain